MKSIITAGLVLCSFLASAQDFPFGRPSSEDLQLKIYAKDTSANAVVLREFGTARVDDQNGNLIFEYHVRIKIFNSRGFGQGNIEIPIRVSDASTYETIRDIRGITFYLDENNSQRATPLDEKQIFTEKKAGKYYNLTKFALPNVRENCIIEYSYEIESPFLRTFRKWDFQSDIPKLYSEFCARIPAVYNYNATLRGPFKLSKNTGEVEKECFSPGGGFKADCSKMTYAMGDVPAFIEEDYMTAASNFKAAMSFELSDYVDYRGGKHNLSKEWKDVDRDLKTEPWFGVQLKRKDVFKDKLPSVLANKTTDLDKAKAIYSFMQTWFKWNNYYGKYSDIGIKKAFENRSGSSADINLALVTAMMAADLKAEPVILSTRQNGLINPLFPIITDFDYVICNVTIDEKSYLLDATDPMLPFGLLPLRCINEKGRLMSFNKPSSWIELKASQKETKNIRLDLTVDDLGKISGDVIVTTDGYAAYDRRKAVKKFNSTEEYVEDLDERLPKIKIIKSTISNLDSLENPLTESYKVDINGNQNGQINISPYFMNRITDNPFKLAERTYPVDLGTITETRVIMQLKFPDKFTVHNSPVPLALSLPNNGGRFITQASVDGNRLMLSYMMQLTKSVYTSEEYYYLKELYNKIIQTQQNDIILKEKI